MADIAIEVRELGKTYRVYPSPWQRILEKLTRRPRHKAFEALHDVGFRLPRGEGLALIGENGAGKSTLLKILAGVTRQTRGTVDVNGRIAAILELGSGFHPELSGRENIRFNAALLGLEEAETEAKIPRIIEFSELGSFIDQPVKNYSTGMAMRLGFAIATQVEPDILIVDEALSVGDGYFQKKCMDVMHAFVEAGGTLLFCTHAMYYVATFCQQALWLRNGRMEAFGEAIDVIRDYENFLTAKGKESRDSEVRSGVENWHGRLGDVELTGGRPQDGSRQALHREPIGVRITWGSDDPARLFHLAVGLDRVDGVQVLSFSSFLDGRSPWTGATEYEVELEIPELPLLKGEFTLTVYLLDEHNLHPYDMHEARGALGIDSPEYRVGLFECEHAWKTVAGARKAAKPAVAG